MRWLVICLVLFGARPAAARLVIMEPTVAHKCPRAKTWDKIEVCLKAHGTVQVLRTLQGAKLVSLEIRESGQLIEAGVYLYLARGGEWRLGGLYEGAIDLLAFHPLTLAKHTGYQIDFGQVIPSAISLDDGSSAPATFRIRRSLFCGGDNYGCTEVMTSCDILVRGKAYFVFRGTLSIQDNNLVIVSGDRSRAGTACSGIERVFLGWEQP